MSMKDNQQKNCGFYLKELEELPNQQEIQTQIMSCNIDDKIKSLKKLIICILHDDNYPRMIMNVLQSCAPSQQCNHRLKKTLMLYWEVVDKVKEDKVTMKDEMIMVVNSLRSDVLHSNEYIRGRTMRLLSRIPYRAILESLTPSIVENLKHSHAYVRRNALQCLFKVYMHFKDELINDIGDTIGGLLQSESDLGCQRLAFRLLWETDTDKAYAYLESQVLNQEDSVSEQLQLSILDVLRRAQKEDPSSHTHQLVKVILLFIKQTKSSALQLECANALVECSSAYKLAQNLYLQLLAQHSENNVKLFILDKLLAIRTLNHTGLQEQVLELAQALNTKSSEIRCKTLDIIKQLSCNKNVLSIFSLLMKELEGCGRRKSEHEEDYKEYLLEHVGFYCEKYGQVLLVNPQESIVPLISTQLMHNNPMITRLIKQLVLQHLDIQPPIIELIHSHLQACDNIKLAYNMFWTLGHCESVLDQSSLDLMLSILQPFPLSLSCQQSSPLQPSPTPTTTTTTTTTTNYKTVILQDGTYGTEANTSTLQPLPNPSSSFSIRNLIINNSYLATIWVNTIIKILFRLQSLPSYNSKKNNVLIALCALVRVNQNRNDGNLQEKLKIAIKYLTNPKLFSNLNWLKQSGNIKKKESVLKINKNSKQQQQPKILKQCQDLLHFRQLKPKNALNVDANLDEIEISQQIKQNKEETNSYTKRLTKIIQLTGYSDPVYAEAFVDFHKYDIKFEILLINRTKEMLQNLQIEFISQGEMRAVEKQCINLQKEQTQMIRQQMKLSSSEISTIYGSISWDNKQGGESQYLITNEIQIDLTEFNYPHYIDLDQFRIFWQKYQWENRIIINTNIQNIEQFLQQIKEKLNLQIISEYDSESDFVSVNMYAKTTLDDDFLVNTSLEKVNNKIQGYIRIRSQSKGLILNLGETLKQIQIV